MATSFFNDKNRNIAPVLAELIVEANQELPDWLEDISRDSSRGGGRGGNTGRRGGGQRFGGRDHRVQVNSTSGGRSGGFSGYNAFGGGGFNGMSNGSNWGGGPPQRQFSAGPTLTTNGGGFIPSGVNRPQQSTTKQVFCDLKSSLINFRTGGIKMFAKPLFQCVLLKFLLKT